MNQKRMLFTILFSLWIGAIYVGAWGQAAKDMTYNLAFLADDPVYLSTFQRWVLNVFSVGYDSIFITIAVGIFAYHHRNFRPWRYIMFGLFLRYFVLILFISFSLYRHSLTSILDELLEVADYEFYALGTFQLTFTVVASYAGMSIGLDEEYLDEKDEQLGYLAGRSKKIWALVAFAYNPVIQLATKLSIVSVYNVTDHVASSESWNYSLITGILISLIAMAWIWIITVGLLYYGIRTIGDKQAAYRRAKIIGIFVVVPVFVVGIPLIRHRDLLSNEQPPTQITGVERGAVTGFFFNDQSSQIYPMACTDASYMTFAVRWR